MGAFFINNYLLFCSNIVIKITIYGCNKLDNESFILAQGQSI